MHICENVSLAGTQLIIIKNRFDKKIYRKIQFLKSSFIKETKQEQTSGPNIFTGDFKKIFEEEIISAKQKDL